jgi:hypothetical protein
LQVNVPSLTNPNNSPNDSLVQPPTQSRKNRLQTWLTVFAAATLAIFAVQSFRGGRISAQDFPVEIGRIEGDDLAVVTATPVGIETHASPTVVASGSDVTLRSGHALIALDAGGEISVCGPAHFKMIKSAGAVTLALDYGRVHPNLDSSETFTIFTPTIIATPMAIAGGSRDIAVGLEQGGEMCILARRGAMRVEPQFSDQSLLVPQGGTVNMSGGQIDSLHGDFSECSCEFPRAEVRRPKPTAPQPPLEISTPRHPEESEANKNDNLPPPAVSPEEPVYTVLMPPLAFDANSRTPPVDPDPETILLIREVRMRPTVVFRGHVNPAPSPARSSDSEVSSHTPAAPPALPVPSDHQPAQSQPGILDRVRNFFHKITS